MITVYLSTYNTGSVFQTTAPIFAIAQGYYYEYEFAGTTYNATASNMSTYKQIPNFSGIGPGCASLRNCNNSGVCDYCAEKCHCFDGFGSDTDLVNIGRDLRPDCTSSKSSALLSVHNNAYFVC